MVIGTPTWLLLAATALNSLLLTLLLTRSSTGSASTAQFHPAAHRTAEPCTQPALSLSLSPPPPPPLPTACPDAPRLHHLRPSARRKLPTADDEAWLKHVWRMKPHWSPKEVSNASWAFLSERQISRGIVSRGDPVRLQCLAEKLLGGGAARLNVVGGSVSFGTTFTTSKSHALFHWKVYQWLNASFPRAPHEHYCGAVPASGPSYMEHCVYWHVPSEPSIILVDYAVNFDADNDDASAFERMLRKLLALPGRPAVVLVNTMEIIPPKGKIPFANPSVNYSDPADHAFTYASPPEDAIVALAHYYGVPCVSLRGALYPEFKVNDSSFPLKAVFHDRHHPAAWGHSLLSQMIVRLLHDAVSTVHAAPSQPGRTPRCAEALRERGGLAPPLIPPLLSPHAEADVGMCAKADELQKYLVSAKGFAYGVEGKDAKMKPGVIGTAAGDEARFCVDTSRLALSQPFVVIIGHLISYEHMGQVSVQCEGECGCEEGPIDAHVEGGKFSVFKARTLNLRKVKPAAPAAGARPDCGCIVKLTILEKTGSGERKFKVLSLMTAAREGNMRYGHQAGFNNRPTEARTW